MGAALPRLAACLFALCLTSLTDAAEVNPTARLKIVKTTTLWKSPGGKVGARMARFSPDGRWLAWTTSDGHVILADLRADGKLRDWRVGPTPATFTALAWPCKGFPAVCYLATYEKKPARTALALLPPADRDTYDLFGLEGVQRLVWRPDGKYLSLSTDRALYQMRLLRNTTVKLLDQQKGWRPKGAPAYEDLIFVGERVAARAAGTMKWWLAEAEKKAVALGELRGLCPDPERKALYAVPWKAGPVGIPRGAGIVRIDLAQPGAKPRVIVPFDHSAGKPYWLVDIFDATYPTTLRISPDGKTLTFCGVKAGVPSKNAWREFCIWRVPSDGSKPPLAVAECGNIFKRIDVGDTHFIGWRYKIDYATVLGDLKNGKAWRLPKGFYVQRVNTDVLVDKLLVGAARGKDVVLIQLAEEKE
jgi:WD40 repeat protein